jgi:bacterioferritin-associated ferredoxin
MYVCSCNRLTDTQVEDAICAGAASPGDVYAACGCSPQCGRCATTMARLIDAAACATASLAPGRDKVAA